MRKLKSLFPFKWFRDVSIKKKLYFIIGAMGVLIAIELFTLWFAIHTLSAVRALVGAEGLWSKGQKDGIYYLLKYSNTHDEKDYNAFKKVFAVPLGDHITRTELSKPNPDFDAARNGFIQGKVHPNDIDGMIQLLVRFGHVSYLNKAISYWEQGDITIFRLVNIGDSLHNMITSKQSTPKKIALLTNQIDPVNDTLTAIEDNFSYVLGEGSRWLENLILKIVFGVALTVEITGLTLSIMVTREISKGLKEINRTADLIAKGDLSERAKVFSKNEIGSVAVAINNMTDRLVYSNRELSQFAYIASHDLQEPLRTILNYISLLNDQCRHQLDDDAKKYIQVTLKATTRMQNLVTGILNYSRIGNDSTLQKINTKVVVQEVMQDIDGLLKETSAAINVGQLPVINGFKELRFVFQNLIANAIKFRKENMAPVIDITAIQKNDSWLFKIDDNGIGIAPEHYDRIFTIFQKLHSEKQYAGTGIGLTQCKKVIEMHGGKIWVESTPGKGSTFYFTIPIFV